MATRFVRIDLSDAGRDYRAIAVEPGVPMLDRSGSNNRILFRWLGGMVAEPVWEEESVNFYVRDDQGGRLEEVICQPATEQDLKTILRDDLAKLRSRIDRSVAETPTERILRKILIRSFQDLVDNPARTDQDSYFFRYRDVQGNWRLTWCWGYQRLDEEPAPSVVCTDPDCNLLFVRRPGRSPKCPSCEGTLTHRKVHKTNWRIAALAAALLLLLLGGIYWWTTRSGRLIASPQTYTGQVGARIDVKVVEAGLFRKKDVTRDAVGIAFDPRIARFDPATGTATLLAPGNTIMHFQVGDKKTDIPLSVTPAENPDSLVIEPKNLELGISTTARLKAFGIYKGGNKVELTDAVRWKPQNDGIAFAAGGLIEGLAPGSTTVMASYSASGDGTPVEASAEVKVANVALKSLEVEIDPSKVNVGRVSGLRIDAVAEDGKKYSVLESSRLRVEMSPPSVATAQTRSVRGERAGHGKLAATFELGNLTGEKEFDVGTLPPVDFLVRPENLNLVVGEIADVSVMAPTREPIHISSSRPEVVQVTPNHRLKGLSAGEAEVEVAQGGHRSTIKVNVESLEFDSIYIDPASVAVAVDDAVRPRVMASVKREQPPVAEIAPDMLGVTKTPSPRYASFNPRSIELRGVTQTDPSAPQRLALRHRHLVTREAPVEVYVAPCRLELSPAGPVELPLGQLLRLQGWAHYSGGRKALLPSERLAWKTAEKAPDGLRLYSVPKGAVGALKPDAGPMSVYATYAPGPSYKTDSNRVVFKSVKADETVKLALEIDRTLRLKGENGEAVLSATGANGDVELVPELAQFKSSDDKRVKLTSETSGRFQAKEPGEATLSASHLAAKDATNLKLRVCDPAKARLVLEPANVNVAVNEQAALQLFLEVKEGDKTDRVALEGPGVGYSLSESNVVRWAPPVVTGLVPGKLTLTADHVALGRPVKANIEVTGPETPSAIRVTPSAVTLAPGQSATLTVEQEVGGTWKEVRPDSVEWSVPSELDWSPATADFRPAVTVPAGTTGEFQLQARFSNQVAGATINTKEAGPDARPPATLLLVREPGGRYLPVRHQQRYTILVERDGQTEPAADVRWPERFETEAFDWDPPVLTAKKPGHTQWLRAEVDGRAVMFHTTSYVPGQVPEEPPPSPIKDEVKVLKEQHGDIVSVKILGDDGQSVRFPAGAKFRDYRVEAKFKDGFTKLATKRAIYLMPEPPQEAYVTASNGALVGLRPGKTQLHAEYGGVKSTDPLNVEVTAGVDADKLVIKAPSPIRPGESFPMQVIGYKGGQSIGDITGLGSFLWQSSDEGVARIDGSSITGVKPGAVKVTAKMGSITAEPATVTVSDAIADELRLDPSQIQMYAGQTLRLGSDVSVFRGNLNISQQCDVTSEAPGVVRYSADDRALVGVAPGVAPVNFALGDKIVRVRVDVLPPADVAGGEVVLDPPTVLLAPGQLERMRVLIRTKDGVEVDRSSSAILRSSDEKVVKVEGDQVWAVGPGKAQVAATFSGAPNTAKAAVEVVNEPIEELNVDPGSLRMAVKDRAQLHILGRSKTAGSHELFPSNAMKAAAGGKNPTAIQVSGAEQVDAVAPGEATVDLSYGDKAKAQVPVRVESNALTNLRIDPPSATIRVGDGVPYRVTATRGGNTVVLGVEDGVQLDVENRAVAQATGGMTVAGTGIGRTTVVARLGDQKAEANLEVTNTPAGTERVPDDHIVLDHAHGDRIVDERGHGVYGPDVIVDDGHGGVVVHDHDHHGDVVANPAVEVPANAKGLRFRPDKLSMGKNAEPAIVRVFIVRDDNTDGAEVTADPKLEIETPKAEVAELEQGKEGPVIKPKGEGQCKVHAKLGNLDTTAAGPLWIDIGGTVETASGAKLVAAPDPLTIWSGETTKFDSVRIEPGGDQNPFPVEAYKITLPEGQGTVTVDDQGNLTGKSVGTVEATVTAADPKYQGLSAKVTIKVTTPEKLAIDPADFNLKVGEKTPPINVVVLAADGTNIQAPAKLESADPKILGPTSEGSNQFEAKSQGQTKIRATYRGVEAIATVSITSGTGKRFVSVDPKVNTEGKDDFDVNVTVLADGAEGELEYRVYTAGQAPGDNWVANQPEADSRKAVLTTPRIPRKGWGEMYQLVVEVRQKGSTAVEQYPLTFELRGVAFVGPRSGTNEKQPRSK